LFQVEANRHVIVTSANGRMSGILKTINDSGNDWEYELESSSYADHKFVLKVVDGQLLIRRWTGTEWVASAVVKRTSSATHEAASPASPAPAPIWMIVALASVFSAACLFVCYAWRRWVKDTQENVIEDAVARVRTPPTLLQHKSFEQKEKTAEFGTSQLYSGESEVGVDYADVELELGFGGNGTFSFASPRGHTSTDSMVFPHEDVQYLQESLEHQPPGRSDSSVLSI